MCPASAAVRRRMHSAKLQQSALLQCRALAAIPRRLCRQTLCLQTKPWSSCRHRPCRRWSRRSRSRRSPSCSRCGPRRRRQRQRRPLGSGGSEAGPFVRGFVGPSLCTAEYGTGRLPCRSGTGCGLAAHPWQAENSCSFNLPTSLTTASRLLALWALQRPALRAAARHTSAPRMAESSSHLLGQRMTYTTNTLRFVRTRPIVAIPSFFGPP